MEPAGGRRRHASNLDRDEKSEPPEDYALSLVKVLVIAQGVRISGALRQIDVGVGPRRGRGFWLGRSDPPSRGAPRGRPNLLSALHHVAICLFNKK